MPIPEFKSGRNSENIRVFRRWAGRQFGPLKLTATVGEKRAVIFMACVYPAILLILPAMFFLDPPEMSAWSIVAAASLPAYAVLSWTSWILFIREARKSKRRLAACHMMICPRCRESLDGLPDTGNCPKCGYYYTAFLVRETWSLFYASIPTPSNTPSKPSAPHTPPASPTPPPGASTN